MVESYINGCSVIVPDPLMIPISIYMLTAIVMSASEHDYGNPLIFFSNDGE